MNKDAIEWNMRMRDALNTILMAVNLEDAREIATAALDPNNLLGRSPPIDGTGWAEALFDDGETRMMFSDDMYRYGVPING